MPRVRRYRSGDAPRSKVKEEKEFEQKIVDIARVTRVMAGGKRMSFRACVVIGDRKGRVGMAVRKGADVTIAINKAVNAAKKHLIRVTIINDTVPHTIHEKFSAAYILLKPAPRGTGIIAGGPMRIVLELAGIKNVVAKMIGSRNKINNVKATLEALKKLRDLKEIRELRK